MAEVSSIAWTRSTFNPWIGCTKVGPGCDNCYAEALDKRMRYGKAVHWGAGVPRYRTSVRNWNEPLKWDAFAKAERLLAERRPGDNFKGPLGFWPVFCASLADVFDNEVPAEWRADLMKLIVDTPNLSWLLVTKRIGNVGRLIEEAGDLIDYGEGWQSTWGQGAWPDNVRLLITVCNQEEADRDIPKLLALPCKNGISYEPALGPIDFNGRCVSIPWGGGASRGGRDYSPMLNCLGWVIVGGESTQGAGKARPFDLAWARSTVAQCKAAGVPVFVKQIGSTPVTGSTEDDYLVVGKHFTDRRLKDRAGADPAEWPDDLRVQEFP